MSDQTTHSKPVELKHTDVKRIKPGSPEMAQYLAAGYNLTLEQAKAIIKERDADSAAYPYEVYMKAKAFMEAYDAKPGVVSTKPGWKRTRKEI